MDSPCDIFNNILAHSVAKGRSVEVENLHRLPGLSVVLWCYKNDISRRVACQESVDMEFIPNLLLNKAEQSPALLWFGVDLHLHLHLPHIDSLFGVRGLKSI